MLRLGRIFVMVVAAFMVLAPAKSYALLDSTKVMKVAAADSVWMSGVKQMATPALVSGTSGAVATAQWMTMKIPSARAAAIISAVGLAAAGMVVDYAWDQMYEYLTSPSGANLHYTGIAGGVSGGGGAEFQWQEATGTWGVSAAGQATYDVLMAETEGNWKCDGVSCYTTYDVAGSQSEAYAECMAAAAAQGGNCGGFQRTYWGVYGVSNVPIGGGQYRRGESWQYPMSAYSNYVQFNQTGTNYTTATEAEIQTQIQTDLEAGNPLAVAALNQALARVQDALVSPEVDPLAKATGDPMTNKVQPALVGSLAGDQTAALEDAVANSSAGLTTSAGPVSGSQTDFSTMKKAMEEAIGTTPPQGPDVPMDASLNSPERDSITGYLNSYWNSLATLPLVSLLNGTQVQASGSCVICLNMPGFLGGAAKETCYDYAQHHDVWVLMGNFLLSIVGVVWTMYMFES